MKQNRNIAAPFTLGQHLESPHNFRNSYSGGIMYYKGTYRHFKTQASKYATLSCYENGLYIKIDKKKFHFASYLCLIPLSLL